MDNITTLEQTPGAINFLMQQVADLKEMVCSLLAERATPAPSQPSEYLTATEAKNILKVSYPTLREWRKAGTVPGYRIGNTLRYKAVDIDTALKAVKSSKIAA